MKDAFAALRRGFKVEPHRTKKTMIIECKTCGDRWSYDIDKSPSVGAILHLLNHERGHDSEEQE